MYGIRRDDIADHAVIPLHLGNELHRFSKTFYLGDIDADSDALVPPLWNPPRAITIKRILVGLDTDAAKDNTDYQTISITDGTNTIASIATGPTAGGTSFTAGTFVELTLVANYVAISAAETIKVDFTKTNSGMALSGLQIQIDYDIDDPS